jgi:fatty acid desaturase
MRKLRVAALINDERDRPFLKLMAASAVWAAASCTVLFWPGVFRGWMAALYIAVTMGYFFPPFTLMLHCTSHRPLFQKRFGWMNRLIPWVLGPFYGQTPGTYAAHHIGMHHAEENLWKDKSSTLPFQRDSIVDFGRYFGRFLVWGMPDLMSYLWKNRREKLARQALWGELGFVCAAVALGFYNLPATLTVFVFPVLAGRFLMMCGNWSQHAFIDQRSPENAYRNSITCIEVAYNDRCFNDGYHIGHHLNARLHWTQMREDYERHIDRYASEDALVFRGVDYFVIWALLMCKAHRRLARHVVRFGPHPKSDDEVVALIRERLQPVPAPRLELSKAA